MTPLAIFSTWIALAVPHLLDGQGNHFAARQLPREARDAFALACSEADPFDGDVDGRTCGAFLVVMGGLESAFSLFPRGSNDHGLAAGPFQEWRGDALRTQSWIVSTRHYLATVKSIALRTCPDAPISSLAGERCGGDVHKLRWAQVTRIAALPFPETP